jgi:hypothetical protein
LELRDGSRRADSSEVHMRHPLYTGQAASVVRTTEPILNDLIRRGRITPSPAVIGGRRHWNEDQILQAAECLGLLTDDLRRRLGEEVARVP